MFIRKELLKSAYYQPSCPNQNDVFYTSQSKKHEALNPTQVSYKKNCLLSDIMSRLFPIKMMSFLHPKVRNMRPSIRPKFLIKRTEYNSIEMCLDF